MANRKCLSLPTTSYLVEDHFDAFLCILSVFEDYQMTTLELPWTTWFYEPEVISSTTFGLCGNPNFGFGDNVSKMVGPTSKGHSKSLNHHDPRNFMNRKWCPVILPVCVATLITACWSHISYFQSYQTSLLTGIYNNSFLFSFGISCTCSSFVLVWPQFLRPSAFRQRKRPYFCVIFRYKAWRHICRWLSNPVLMQEPSSGNYFTPRLLRYKSLFNFCIHLAWHTHFSLKTAKYPSILQPFCFYTFFYGVIQRYQLVNHPSTYPSECTNAH